MTIVDLMQIIRKRIVTVIVTFCIVFAAVAAFTFLSPTKYTATAELFATYTGQSDAQQNSSEMSSGASYLSTQIKTYPQLIKTQAVLQPVISDLNLDMKASDLAGMVTATNPSNTFMVDVSVEASSAKQSADIANSVANNLSEQISSALYTDGTNKSPIQLSVVQKAVPPEAPSSPKTVLYLAAGVVLGIIAAIGAALLKDMINTKVDDTDEAKELTQTSSLGTVPRSEIFDDTRPAVVGNTGSREAEEFRRIRTNIAFLNPDARDHGHLLVITSTEPSEGKTTVSVNTAAAIAEDGKTVLLIDADLRHPSVAKSLGIEGHVGLSHILSGQASPRDIVQKYWKPNFHVLPAGKRPGNASILLNSQVMHEMVEQALQQYDYVILDTAPMSVSNDAAVFGRLADGVVMVVGKGVAEKKELESTVQALSTAEVPVLGYVFNLADPKKIHSKNYYYYGESAPKGDKGKNKAKDKDKNKRH
ncbi:MAG: polysaccharide biosynthesis tyrosine autokinase [Bifidobacterium tibiigranuli]|nr:polysaccharide biosynthesis tyrosine autokinase [Bifidobacterium tibiigranuli]